MSRKPELESRWPLLSTFRRIFALLTSSERQSVRVLLGFMVIGVALEILGIGLVIPAVALLTQGDVAAGYPELRPALDALGNPSQGRLIAGGMLALVGIYLVKNLFLGFLVVRQTRFAYGVQAQLSQRLFAIYLRQPYTFHLQRNSAGLIRNVTREVNEFTHTAVAPMLRLFIEGPVLTGLAILLLVVEPVGTFIVALVFGSATWGFYRSNRARIAGWGQARQAHEGMRMQHLQQGLGAVKEVILLGREHEFLSRYASHNSKSASAEGSKQALQQIPPLWFELLGIMGLATLVLTMLARGRDIASVVPTLGLFVAAAFRLIPSVNRILVALQSLRFSLPVINTLHDEFRLTASVLSGEQAGAAIAAGTEFQKDICLSKVSYTYAAALVPALDTLTMVVRKGETVGLVGSSGSGKSTLVDVMLGLLVPDAGQVLADGSDVRSRLRTWQNQVGYVPQSIYLTDDSIRRNVGFGLSDDQVEDAAVARAVRAAQLDDFVASLPEGLDTMVGERGVRLSGGQRQRIGIARALYHDPAVLVLDEATSALDSATERGVMDAVAALHGTKTILIVAHRVSTVERCDRVYRLEQGQIVSDGQPDAIHPVEESVSPVQG